MKGYGIDSFREDEKRSMMAAGRSAGGPLVFLLKDTQILDETFLEDINSILNSGEVGLCSSYLAYKRLFLPMFSSRVHLRFAKSEPAGTLTAAAFFSGTWHLCP